MNLLFIWAGDLEPLPAYRRAAVEATRAMYPDARALCISRWPEFLPGFEVLPWDAVVEEMAADLDVAEVPVTWRRGYMAFSDWARFWFLAKNPDTFYLDTDARPVAPIPLGGLEKFTLPYWEIFALYAPQNGAAANLLPILRQLKARNLDAALLQLAETLRPLPWVGTFRPNAVEHLRGARAGR